MADNRIEVHITAENEQFVSKMQEVVRALERTRESSKGTESALSGLGGKLANIGMIVTGAYAGFQMLSAAIESTIGSIMQYSMSMENSQAAFGVFLGNAQLAAQYTQDLKKIAADTPFDLPGVMDAGKKLLAFGFDAQTSLNLLRTIGDASAALGLGTEGIDRITLAIGQIQAKGRVMGDELLQLTEAGIPAQEILAEKLGLTADQVKNIGDAGIDANTAIQALTDGMNERFSGMAETLSNNMQGLISTIEDNLQNIGGFAFEPLFEGLKNGLRQVRDLTDEFVGVINGTEEVDADSPILHIIAFIQAGMEEACNLAQQFMELFGSFDTDGTFYPSEETLEKLSEVGAFFEQIYQLAVDIGEMLISLEPIFEEIISQVGWWLGLLISIADTLVNFVKAGADACNDSFATTKVIIDLIVGALAGFMIMNTIIGLAKSLATAYLAVKAAIMAAYVAIKRAAIAQAAWNALMAVGHLLKTPQGMVAAAVGTGVAATAINIGWNSGWIQDKLNGLKSSVENALSVDVGGIEDGMDAKVQALLNRVNTGGGRIPYPAARPSAIQQNGGGSGGSGGKASQQAAKKAAQEQLQQNRHYLQEQNEMIKAHLDEMLDALKDTMESIQVQYEQSNIGWAQYSTEKILNEIQQEQARIEAIKQQIAAAQSSGAYQTQEELDSAVNKLQMDLEKHIRALEKLTDAQQDVADVIAFYGNQHSITPYTDAANQQNVANTQQAAGAQSNTAASSMSAMPGGTLIPKGATPEEASLFLAYEKNKPNDKTGLLTLDTLLGVGFHESGLQHWLSNGNVKMAYNGDGGVGLMQLTSDYAKGLAGNPYDLWMNADGGTKLIVELLNQYGNLEEALYHYNGSGPMARKYAREVLQDIANQVPRATELMNAPKIHDSIVPDYAAAPVNEPAAAQSVQQTKAEQEQAQTQQTQKIADAIKEAHYQMASGVNHEGFDETTEQKLRLLDEYFAELTNGVHLFITSMRDGTHSDPNHAAGRAFDVANDELYDNDLRAKVIAKANELGLRAYDEYDRSNWTGNTTGDNLHLSDTGKPINVNVVGLSSAASANIDAKKKEGLEAKKAAEKALEDAQNVEKEINGLGGDVSTIQVEQLRKKTSDLEKRLIANGYKEEAEKLKGLFEAKANQYDFKSNANYLKFAIDTIKGNADDMVYMIGDELMDSAEYAKKYLGYMKGGNLPGGKYDIKTILENFRKQLKAAEKAGDADTMMEVTKAINSIQDDLVKMVKDFAQSVEERASWESSMIDANMLLSAGQKERAKKEIERQKQGNLGRINRAIAESYYQRSLVFASHKDDEGNTPEKHQYQAFTAMSDYYARQAALNEELARTPTLLEEVRATAKDSLEDGLVTFLTDGILEAESLGDALKNLATSILKDLQKIFAKSIVADLMDKWFPQVTNKGNATTEGYHQTQAISAQIAALGEQLAITPELLSPSISAWNASMSELGMNLMNTTTGFQLQSTNAGIGFMSAMDGLANTIVSSVDAAASAISAGGSLFSIGIMDGVGWGKHATGGLITGQGTDTSDNIPAMLSPGEFVVKAKAVRKYGLGVLQRINEGRWGNLTVHVPHFAKGGIVGDAGAAAAGKFSDSVATTLSTAAPTLSTAAPTLRVTNYVDGQRVFDNYGKSMIRTEIEKHVVKNMKLRSEMGRRY